MGVTALAVCASRFLVIRIFLCSRLSCVGVIHVECCMQTLIFIPADVQLPCAVQFISATNIHVVLLSEGVVHACAVNVSP